MVYNATTKNKIKKNSFALALYGEENYLLDNVIMVVRYMSDGVGTYTLPSEPFNIAPQKMAFVCFLSLSVCLYLRRRELNCKTQNAAGLDTLRGVLMTGGVKR